MKQLLPLLLLCCIPYALGKNNLELAKKAEQLPRLVMYDSSYRQIDYPNGDIPSHYGVCSDVVIRSYRQLGIDLQKRLHEDIKKTLANIRAKKYGDLVSLTPILIIGESLTWKPYTKRYR